MTELRAGTLLHIGRAASVQFVSPIWFRLIRVLDWVTYDGWVWLDGYQLDAKGDAIARRTIFVQKAGLHRPAAPAHPAASLRPGNRESAGRHRRDTSCEGQGTCPRTSLLGSVSDRQA